MSAVAALLDRVPWFVAVMACATIGLAPFTPPHIVEKLRMLVAGRLVKPIDIFDFALHVAAAAREVDPLAGRALTAGLRSQDAHEQGENA